MHADHEINRESWDELAAVHGQDAYYDSRALIAGASSLIEEEEAALADTVGADLAGVRVVHMQCHIGFDAITFARRGAYVTGVDFSNVALDKARSLAQRCGVQVEWVCADVTALPVSLNGQFDLAWATMGVLCWIADVHAWMRAVAGTLAGGGRLVMIDGHPGDQHRKADPARIEQPGTGSTRRTLDAGWDYATEMRTGPQVLFLHSLGAVVSAAADAGLRVTELREHSDVSCDLCVKDFVLQADGRYRRRADGDSRPVLFTLIAQR